MSDNSTVDLSGQFAYQGQLGLSETCLGIDLEAMDNLQLRWLDCLMSGYFVCEKWSTSALGSG